MKVKYRKKFLKDLYKLPLPVRLQVETFVFDTLPKVNSIAHTHNIEKIKGFTSYYKVRFGSYRVGIKVERDVVILERVLHRKDIYRYFP